MQDFVNVIYENDTQVIYATKKGYWVRFNTEGNEEDIFLSADKAKAIKKLDRFDAEGFLATQLEKSEL